MQSKLVSVITPCYNTGKYLPNLLDSVLAQTYPFIEMIIIDDGSTDNTTAIIEEYIPRFRKKSILFHCVKQSNSGQSAAIQRGLDMINGEYLVWPDSDDYYAANDVIEKMVKRMESAGDDVAMVRTQELIIEDSSEHRIIGLFGDNASEIEPRTLFEDCLFADNGYYFCPGAYMVRITALKRATRFPIYTEKNAGQNWQLMLPILYHYRCSTILEPLYHIIQREDSHSRGQFEGYENTMGKYIAYYNTIVATLDNILDMDKEEHDNYQERIHKKYLTILLSHCLGHLDKKNANIFYQNLVQKSIPIPFKYRLKVLLLNMGLLSASIKLKRLIA